MQPWPPHPDPFGHQPACLVPLYLQEVTAPPQHCGLQGSRTWGPEQESWEVEDLGGEGGLLARSSQGSKCPCSASRLSPTPEAQRESGLGQTKGAQRGKQVELTCGQGRTPEGQEKQQPRPGHGPPERRQDTAAGLRCGLGSRHPQDCLPGHRPSCTSAAPPRSRFPREGPPTHPGPQTRSFVMGPGTQGATPTAGAGRPHSSHLKSHWPSTHLQDTGPEAARQGLVHSLSFHAPNHGELHFTGEATEAQRG